MKINELELNKSYLLLDLDGTKKEVKILSKEWVVNAYFNKWVKEYTMLFIDDGERVIISENLAEIMEFEEIKKEKCKTSCKRVKRCINLSSDYVSKHFEKILISDTIEDMLSFVGNNDFKITFEKKEEEYYGEKVYEITLDFVERD